MKKIGVFDSGIGGLTVLRALRRRAPRADFVFLGDLARVPYGVHDQPTILSYARSDAEFLLSQGADAIVIACNTATAAALDALREELDVPVWGVIAPAAEEAVRLSRGGIAVMATEATVRSGSYERTLHALRPGGEYHFLPCQKLVSLIERGVPEEAEEAVEQCRAYLAPIVGKSVDTLVLGCTHFPLYSGAIASLLPGVKLVDSGEALAGQLSEILREASGEGRTDYCVTARSEAFERAVERLDGSAAPGCVRCVGAL